jgi:hypothetical protein
MVAKLENLRMRVVSEIEDLPEDALAELLSFVEYQRYKATRDGLIEGKPNRPVALEGIAPEFDLSEDEIAEVRREMWAGFGERDI